MIRAGLAGLAGDVPESIRLFQTAFAELRSVGVPFDESLAGILMASVLDPSLPEVRAAADRAREILVRLGAQAFLEQLDGRLARDPGTAPSRTRARQREAEAVSVEAEP